MFGFGLRIHDGKKSDRDDLEHMLTAALEHEGTLRVGVNPRAKYTTIKSKDGKRRKRKRPVPVWLALAWNEYGSPKRRLPERRVLRTTVYRSGRSWNASLRMRFSLIQRGIVKAKDTMSRLGRRIVKDFRDSLETARPANAEATIDEKGFDRPMIWTKKLWSAIQWEWIPSSSTRSAGAVARSFRKSFDSLASGKTWGRPR